MSEWGLGIIRYSININYYNFLFTSSMDVSFSQIGQVNPEDEITHFMFSIPLEVMIQESLCVQIIHITNKLMYKIHSTESLQKPALMVEWEEMQQERVKRRGEARCMSGNRRGKACVLSFR